MQSPVPRHLDIQEAFERISPEKDIDGFNPVSIGKLCLNQETYISCTPFGIIKILDEYNIDVKGKQAVIIGRSNIVGKPMALSLLNRDATVTICHSKTKNLKEITKEADILIAAVGAKHYVTADMVKDRRSSNRCRHKPNRRRAIRRCRLRKRKTKSFIHNPRTWRRRPNDNSNANDKRGKKRKKKNIKMLDI